MTLALKFAMQAAFPAPFYFFDEIDAALDAATAQRVGIFIRAQRNAQYLVQSPHKACKARNQRVNSCFYCVGQLMASCSFTGP